jgi:hypothetical protein
MTRRPLVRGAGAAASVLLVLLAGCGRPPVSETPGPAPGVTASTPAPKSTNSVPPSPASADPEDGSFSFDDIASFEGDAEIEITGTSGRTATTGMTGAAATKGQMVVVSVLIRNLSTEDRDATTVLVTATSGADDIEAPLINDPSGGLANGFLGTITPGAEDTADYGFAIPFSALNQVRVTVDLGDGRHEPVTFAGPVEREQ